jgi:hypothetical protein
MSTAVSKTGEPIQAQKYAGAATPPAAGPVPLHRCARWPFTVVPAGPSMSAEKRFKRKNEPNPTTKYLGVSVTQWPIFRLGKI